MKDPIAKLVPSFAVYHFRCQRCHYDYVGEIEDTFGKD